MEYKIFELAKTYKITLKELGCKGISSTYLTKIKKGDYKFKQQHFPLLVDSFNKAFLKRNINKTISLKELYITPQKELDELINQNIINKTIYNKTNREQIELFSQKNEVHNLKYRYLIAKYHQNINEYEKALELYYNLIDNFNCDKFFYSILIEIIRLEKVELTYSIYLKYIKKIQIAPYKAKALLSYNTAVNLLEVQKWKTAISLFNIVINFKKITKYYHSSCNNIGICYQNLKEYETAISFFKLRVSDPSNYNDLEICYTNIISCAKSMGNTILLRITIKKLEKILLELENERLYQTYWNLGLAYLYLNEKKKAITLFEKEVFNPIDLNHQHFSIVEYLDSIKQLTLLYELNSSKHQTLIKTISKIPNNLITYEFILFILKFYINNSLEYEAKLLILKIPQKEVI